MGNLKILDLSGTAIKDLLSSIGHLKAIQSLNLWYCENLMNLPESICDWRSLHTLNVERCSKLERLEVNLNAEDGYYLGCRVLKPGVIWRNGCFSPLKALNLHYCNQMEAAKAPNHP